MYLTNPLLKLKHYLPNEVEVISADASILPSGGTSIVQPFLGFVINMNVVTRAHRDVKDHHLCLVMPIGDFKDGELCFFESGLVIPLSHGDIIVFASRDITHFNLHYRGRRASFVYHTDNAITDWTKFFNHWGENKYFA